MTSYSKRELFLFVIKKWNLCDIMTPTVKTYI